MKNTILGISISLLTLFSFNVFAENNYKDIGKNEIQHKEKYEKYKNKKEFSKDEILKRIADRKDHLKEKINKLELAEICVAAAQNKKEINDCHSKNLKNHHD